MGDIGKGRNTSRLVEKNGRRWASLNSKETPRVSFGILIDETKEFKST